MDGWLYSFMMGAVVCLGLPQLPSINLLILLSLMTFLFIVCGILKPIRGLLIGFMWLGSLGQWLISWQPPIVEKQAEIRIEGKIRLINERQVWGRKQLILEVSCSRWNKRTILWWQPAVRLFMTDSSVDLAVGDRISLVTRLKPITSLRNETSFYPLKWMKSRYLVAQGYVKEEDLLAVNLERRSKRPQVIQSLSTASQSLENQGLFLALAAGERQGLSRENWELFSDAGVAHLFAISGLHLGLVALFSWMLLSRSGWLMVRLFPQQCNLVIIYQIVTLVCCTAYAWLAGFSIPTARAWSFVLLMLALTLIRIKVSKVRFVGLIMCGFTLLDPMGLMNSGFWMSFGAVMCLVFLIWSKPGVTIHDGVSEKLFNFIKLQWGLLLLLTLITGIILLKVSPAGFVANLILIPMVSFVLMPVILFMTMTGILGMTMPLWLLGVCDLLLDCVVAVSSWCVELFPATPLPQLPNYMEVLSISIGVVALFLPTSFKSRLGALALLVVSLVTYWLNVERQVLGILVLDVGQGTSVVVQQGDEALIYDLGQSNPKAFTSVSRVLAPFLRSKGINKLTYVFISHGDSDHRGDIEQLSEAFNVNTSVGYSVPGTCTKLMNNLKWKDVQLSWLAATEAHNKDNNQSCVLKIDAKGKSFLLPGDIEKGTESWLVKYHNKWLKSDVLLAPHHGSRTSSSHDFITAVSPDDVVITASRFNRWNFPHPDPMARYCGMGANIYITGELGQVGFVLEDGYWKHVNFEQSLKIPWSAKLNQARRGQCARRQYQLKRAE